MCGGSFADRLFPLQADPEHIRRLVGSQRRSPLSAGGSGCASCARRPRPWFICTRLGARAPSSTATSSLRTSYSMTSSMRTSQTQVLPRWTPGPPRGPRAVRRRARPTTSTSPAVIWTRASSKVASTVRPPTAGRSASRCSLRSPAARLSASSTSVRRPSMRTLQTLMRRSSPMLPRAGHATWRRSSRTSCDRPVKSASATRATERSSQWPTP
mmetsp:Transcript_35315/g.103480  ORF Transcript_35315/g.103480 Transcript_35315/m.103480 type:complete len:213 (-) Transcript_35315:685-1323(-)